jgi:hypothetical protein
MYDESIGTRIIEKIHEKGWNVYERPENTKNLWHHEMIRHDSVDRLEERKSYVLLPRIEDKRNPEKVMGRLQKMANENGWTTPKITGLVLDSESVRLNTLEDYRIAYECFLEALNGLADIN